MAKDFVKLSEVAIKEEVSENATVLVEENGEIYRAPKTQVGGAGGIKTAIIRDGFYLNVVNEISKMPKASAPVYECINMTFEEAYETMKSGEPLAVMGMFAGDGALCLYGSVIYAGQAMGSPCIILNFTYPGSSETEPLYWTQDGLSIRYPGNQPS